MTKSMKRVAMLCLTATLLSIVLLSSSLSSLRLQSGTPFPGADSHYTTEPTVPPSLQAYSFTVLQGLLGLILLLLMVYIPIRLLALANLRRLLVWFFRLILALAALFVLLLILSYINFGPTGILEGIRVANSPSPGASTSPLGKPPDGLIWFVTIGFSLVVGFLIIRIIWQPLHPHKVADPLLEEAKSAAQALQAGAGLKNVIIHCYLQMTAALKQERGIERSHDMTTREFEDWLVSRGMPRLPVQQLTGLFEKVRYGAQSVSEVDEKMALESLGEIIRFAESNESWAP